MLSVTLIVVMNGLRSVPAVMFSKMWRAIDPFPKTSATEYVMFPTTPEK